MQLVASEANRPRSMGWVLLFLWVHNSSILQEKGRYFRPVPSAPSHWTVHDHRLTWTRSDLVFLCEDQFSSCISLPSCMMGRSFLLL
ncbi:hypothetical protein B0O80DRAFT_444248 [Mortierella sp. GBAus27b]|nr:hypothetical protein B0O80DRAFT_444248 [Mortierella sp. GBAus27b]